MTIDVGVVAPAEGGSIVVEIRNGTVEIFGDPAGWRDLTRWCLAVSDEHAPAGSHVHPDAGIGPLDPASAPVMLARHRTGR